MDTKTKQVLLELLDSSSDEDDSVFDDFFANRISSDDSLADVNEEEEDPEKDYNFMDIIDEYSGNDFKSFLKLKRSTVEQIIAQYAQSDIFSKLQRGGKKKIGARREVYLYVWYITNTMTFKQLGHLFGIVKSSAWGAVGRVSNWLVSKSNEYIKWPRLDAFPEKYRKFKAKSKIPGVIGVMDCTHITIAAPKENKERYFNRKHNYSVVLQAVVDAEMKFIDICCGEPGSLNKNSVLRRSALYKTATTDYNRLFPRNTFILCDRTYASTNWLVPPFEELGQLTDRQKSFNRLHSESSIVIQQAFALLKERFKRLNTFTEQRNLESVKNIIVSACVLHNLCLINNDHHTMVEEKLTPASVSDDSSEK